MPEFRIVKRTDVPTKGAVGSRVQPPMARLHSNGTLHLSVRAAAALSDHDCHMLAEFDVDTRILRLTVINGEAPPWGLTKEECFMMRVRKPPKGHHNYGAISVQGLFGYIGFRSNGAQTFEIVELDPDRHSISFLLPAEQFTEPCEDSSD